MPKRLSRDEYYMGIADLVSRRSTCIRRSVGCIAINKHGHIMSTGYNGTPRGLPHCIDNPCAGATSKSGEGLSLCQSAHAEINCLLQCPNVMDIDVIYCTTKPCGECVKAICNTGCKEVVYRDDYPHEYAVTINMRKI